MFKKTLIAAALAVAATGAFAQVYVEGALGQGNVNAEWSGAASQKKTSSGNKFAVGYELRPGWAVEGMMISYGKSTGTYANASSGELKATGTAFGAVYSPDLGGAHGFKVGLYYGSNKANLSGSAVTAASESKGQLNLGLGYVYSFNKNTALTASYDSSTVKLQTQSASVSLMSVGVRFKF